MRSGLLDSLTSAGCLLLLCRLHIEELGCRLHGGLFAECLFDELARLNAISASEALGFDYAIALGIDGDLNSLIQAAPPTLTVSLIEPLSSFCSITEWPFWRARLFARSTA